MTRYSRTTLVSVVITLAVLFLLFLLGIVASVARAETPKKYTVLFHARSVSITTAEYIQESPLDRDLRIYHEGQNIHIGPQVFRIAVCTKNFVAVNGVAREFRCVGVDKLRYTVAYLVQYTGGRPIYATLTLSTPAQTIVYHTDVLPTHYERRGGL